jgi:hypothetical protein
VVSVLSSDGGRTAYLPAAKGRKRQVVSGVARGDSLTVSVVGVSAHGATGRAGRATLKAKAKAGGKRKQVAAKRR